MVISESGLCAAMKAAFKKKSTGYKVAACLSKDGEEEIILSAPNWIAIINRENAPRKVLALIVEHVGDLPAEGKAYQLQDTKAQTEIYSMAVPELSEPVADATVKRTQLQYMGYQIWQRTDNQNIFMISPKHEDMLDHYNRPVTVAENGMVYAEGLVSRLYL